MPKMPSNAGDKQHDAFNTTTLMMENIVSEPMVITAVQRKANVGNYETIDLYMAVAVPLKDVNPSDKESLSQAVSDAAMYGFNLVAKETGDRYVAIKESIKSR